MEYATVPSVLTVGNKITEGLTEGLVAVKFEETILVLAAKLLATDVLVGSVDDELFIARLAYKNKYIYLYRNREME